MSHKTKALIIIFCIITMLCGCKTPPMSEPVKKDGKVYGVTKGSFRHRWWNYYERALSFADGSFWKEAEDDLREAIRQREDDQRRARTYGFHFTDYFPHRELGVVLFNQDRLEEAIKELATSLSTWKSSKAELYLDRARKALLEKKKTDKLVPEIIIRSPAQGALTNRLSVVIQGTARDDTFVRHIRIGEKDVRVDISNQEIPFHAEVPLVPGENRIRVSVSDLTGKTSQAVVTVNADRVGPVIRIDEPGEGDPIPSAGLSVRGYAVDNSGIAEWRVNGEKFSHDGSRELQIQKEIALHSGKKELIIEVQDRAGNVTSAKILLGESPERASGSRPVIRIRNMEEEQVTYLNQAFIEGNIRDDEKVGEILINGKQILKAPGKNIYFSHLTGLKKGKILSRFRGRTSPAIPTP